MVQMLTDPSNLLTAFVALVVFATIITLAAPVMSNNGLESRLKSVANRREELRRRSRAAMAQKGAAGSRLGNSGKTIRDSPLATDTRSIEPPRRASGCFPSSLYAASSIPHIARPTYLRRSLSVFHRRDGRTSNKSWSRGGCTPVILLSRSWREVAASK